MKIIVTSDVHGQLSSLQAIASHFHDADAFIDCGDTELPPERIEPFVSVEGNNDYYYDYPAQRVVEYGGIKILVIHSHRVMMFKRDQELAKKARAIGAKAVFFGHFHVFIDQEIDGIRLISPGSVSHNRDQTPCSFAIVSIEEGRLSVKRVNLSQLTNKK
jgi:putative phosphoesterase